MAARFETGQVVLRREVWRGKAWLVAPERVVQDTDDLLALYLAEGTEFGFPEGDWPGGKHPWHGRGGWEGHGPLELQRPGDPFAVWVFWEGESRRLAGWYVNFQAPFRRTGAGVDTLDHELDIWIPDGDGRWEWKDRELLDQRVREGRFTSAEAEAILAEGERVAARLDRGERWWDESWADWEPDPRWPVPQLPPDWDAAR